MMIVKCNFLHWITTFHTASTTNQNNFLNLIIRELRFAGSANEIGYKSIQISQLLLHYAKSIFSPLYNRHSFACTNMNKNFWTRALAEFLKAKIFFSIIFSMDIRRYSLILFSIFYFWGIFCWCWLSCEPSSIDSLKEYKPDLGNWFNCKRAWYQSQAKRRKQVLIIQWILPGR